MAWIPLAAAGVTALASIYAANKASGDANNKPKYQSDLSPQQQKLADQAARAGLQPGAGGAFGEAADYYRSNLGNNPEDFDAFAAPELRKYNEDIVPGLSEQFAGMGAGGLSSSGFRNAQIQGATDLSERLGALRAQLRQQSAQGLMNIGQAGLGHHGGPTMNQPQSSGWANFAQGAGQAGTTALTNYLGDYYKNQPQGGTTPQTTQGNNVGVNTTPYASTGNYNASPTLG